MSDKLYTQEDLDAAVLAERKACATIAGNKKRELKAMGVDEYHAIEIEARINDRTKNP